MEMPATTELLSRYRPIRKHNKSSSNEMLFPKNEKNARHTRGRSPHRKCSPYLLDGDEAPNASPDTIDKQSSGKINNGRRNRSDNSTKLEGPSMEPLVKEVDGQEVLNGEYEEYLQEGGGNEPEEFMPPPGPNVHPNIIPSEDQTRGMLFLMRFARAWEEKKQR
jgi:hypothetical protein